MSTAQERRQHRLERMQAKAEAEAKAAEAAKEQQRLDDERFMKEALKQARRAEKYGEVPIGCVIVRDGEIISRGYNRRNTNHTTLAHAELLAIDRASRKLSDWRLEGCTLYVTLEPCQMCAGAIVQSRIDRVVIGTMNPKAGCAGSILNILQIPQFNHQVDMTIGVLEEASSALLREFFRALRVRNRQEKEERRAEAERSGKIRI